MEFQLKFPALAGCASCSWAQMHTTGSSGENHMPAALVVGGCQDELQEMLARRLHHSLNAMTHMAGRDWLAYQTSSPLHAHHTLTCARQLVTRLVAEPNNRFILGLC